MNVSTNIDQTLSPNEAMYARLEEIANCLAPFYFRVYECTEAKELKDIREELNSFSHDIEPVASEVSLSLRKTIDACDKAVELKAKKSCLLSGINEVKEWIYEHKRIFGYSNLGEEEMTTVGKYQYNSFVCKYDGKPINTPPQLTRLLQEFLQAPNHKLQKGRIGSLGGVTVRGGAKHRVSDLRKILRKVGAKDPLITYDRYLEEYTLNVN